MAASKVGVQLHSIFGAILGTISGDNSITKPNRVLLLPAGSQIAWDDCCEGQLSLQLVNMVPQLQPGANLTNCGFSYWLATGELTLLRCALTVEDNGKPPTPVALNTEGDQALADLDSMLTALYARPEVTSIVVWTPQGPNGGCMGNALRFTVRLDP